MPFKMHKIIFFQEKYNGKKICVPTQPKIFRPITRHTYFYFIWPYPIVGILLDLQTAYILYTPRATPYKMSPSTLKYTGKLQFVTLLPCITWSVPFFSNSA